MRPVITLPWGPGVGGASAGMAGGRGAHLQAAGDTCALWILATPSPDVLRGRGPGLRFLSFLPRHPSVRFPQPRRTSCVSAPTVPRAFQVLCAEGCPETVQPHGVGSRGVCGWVLLPGRPWASLRVPTLS